MDHDLPDGAGPREPARARRRRDRQRMVDRARRAAASRMARPALAPDPEAARDLERRGIATDWPSLERLRESYARRNADHLAACSCWMCGNPRRQGERTLQERIAEAIADEVDDRDD